MTHAADGKMMVEPPREGGAHPVPDQASDHAQPVFAGTLLFIVLSVMAEYGFGEFAGLNVGQDFGVILGGTIAFAIAVGLVASAIYSWTHRPRGH